VNTYTFENAGVIDPRSISTFGTSSKEGENPIGFFGTGLKYAIAVLLRLGCSIEIISGGQHFKFTTRKTKIRVNEFDLIYMNDQELAFTTELGKKWEPWMAFRELACNTLDEKGKWYDHPPAHNDKNHTFIVVKGRAFDLIWSERTSIILHDFVPKWSDEIVEVDYGPSEWLYYRGVRVMKLERKSHLRYNIRAALDLTEDRTPKSLYMATSRIEHGLQWNADEAMIREALTAPESWENKHVGYAYTFAGKTFKAVALDLVKKAHPSMNAALAQAIRNQHMHEFIGDVRSILDEMDKRRLAKAIEFCKAIGYPVDTYEIIVANMPDNILGMVHDERIYVSTRVFLMGTKMLVGTLLEEYLHLKHRVDDETRQMQNLLIDIIASLGERVTKIAL